MNAVGVYMKCARFQVHILSRNRFCKPSHRSNVSPLSLSMSKQKEFNVDSGASFIWWVKVILLQKNRKGFEHWRIHQLLWLRMVRLIPQKKATTYVCDLDMFVQIQSLKNVSRDWYVTWIPTTSDILAEHLPRLFRCCRVVTGSLDLLVMASAIMPTLKKVNVGIAVDWSAATWPLSKTSSSGLVRNRYHDKMGVDGDRKVSNEAMVEYGKIHARGDVMSDIASSLTWDDDCKTNFVTPTLSIQGWRCRLVARWNGGSDLRSNAHLFVWFFEVVQYSTNLTRSFLRLFGHHCESEWRASRWCESSLKHSKQTALLLLGKVCEDNGYSYEWHAGQPSYLIKSECETDNHVLLVVPGVQATDHQTKTLDDWKQTRAVSDHQLHVDTELPE